MRVASSISEVVRAGLCIGCGLCEAITGARVRMVMTEAGSLRPAPLDGFSPAEEATVLAACPGVAASPRQELGVPIDPVWGAQLSMAYAWAGDAAVRHRAATGGALTALATHALESGRVGFVLHVGADLERPIRSRWVISESTAEIVEHSGSRYGPTSPLAGLEAALDRRRPFAIVAKPCDLGAVHRLGRVDERVDELCTIRLALVCGGQSRLTKTLAVLDQFGIAESDVASLRYRGNGNPGQTRIETHDGVVNELSYLDMWADEAGWQVETRCKLCPDALGEAADVSAADAWPGGAPTGEDEGFNAIVVRTARGRDLVDGAVRAGALVLGSSLTPRQFDSLQPHQVRKKLALAARFEGLALAGAPSVASDGLRLAELGRQLDPTTWRAERDGTAQRVVLGRFAEPSDT